MWLEMSRAAARFCWRSDRGVGDCGAGAVGGTLGSVAWEIGDGDAVGLVVGTIGSTAGCLVGSPEDSDGIGGGLKREAR